MRRKINVVLPSSAISAEQVEQLNIPTNSFLSRYIDYASQCTDAPKVYHLGVGLSTLALAAGKCDLMMVSRDGQREDIPIRMWSAIVGDSGQRKSQSMDLGTDLLRRAGIDFSLPQDASVEAWHDAFSQRPIALLQKDELASMFDAASRSWSNGLKSWMLEMWSGRDRDRLTKGGGNVIVTRPRLNVLGGIPPDVLEKKTNRSDWRSGFLPRFMFWHGKRAEWSEVWSRNPHLEGALASWIEAVPARSHGRIELPYSVIKPINDWFFFTIESQQDNIGPDLFSALTRLQEKAYIILGLLHMSCANVPIVGADQQTSVVRANGLTVTAIQIVRILKQVVEGVFSMTSHDVDDKFEMTLIDIVRRANGPISALEIQKKADASRTKTYRVLEKLVETGALNREQLPATGRGRPTMGFIPA